MPREEHYFYSFALVMCRQPSTGNWLVVKEKSRSNNATIPYVYWLPGGGVERNETFTAAAIREVYEEAGIKVQLKGILRIEHTVIPSLTTSNNRMRIIFYAEPINELDPLKTIPDKKVKVVIGCP